MTKFKGVIFNIITTFIFVLPKNIKRLYKSMRLPLLVDTPKS
jgi:hypothetical protein